MIASIVKFTLAISILAGSMGGAVAWASEPEQHYRAQVWESTRARIQYGRQPEGPLRNMLQLLQQYRYQAQASAGDPSNLCWQHQQQNCLAGSQTCPNPEPPGEQHHHGPQPEQPGPGGPGGNPECPNCDPVGDQHQYGPQPDQPGPGQPGGNPDCTNCDPTGDQNQKGQGGNQRGSGRP